MYPSDTMKDQYTSPNATIFAVTAAVIFMLTSIVFIIYDRWVERRQRVVMSTAVRTQAIVSSFFPATVRDRMMDLNEQDGPAKASFANGAKPLADLFANTTVCFIDIA